MDKNLEKSQLINMLCIKVLLFRLMLKNDKSEFFDVVEDELEKG